MTMPVCRQTLPFRFLLSLALLLALSSTLSAHELGASARTLGVADAARSSGAGTAAIFFNPAGMSLLSMYDIELGYDYEKSIGGHGFHVAVADSKTNKWAALGMSYTYLNVDKGGVTKKGHSVRAALSSGYRSPSFSAFLGADVHWDKLVRSPMSNFEAITGDVGALMEIVQMVRLGIVGHNIVTVHEPSELPISLGLGLSFTYAGAIISFDTLLDFESKKDQVTPVYSIGVEYFLMGMLGLRAGFQANRVDDANRITFGLGYMSQIWGLDVSYAQNLADGGDVLVAAGLRFFLP